MTNIKSLVGFASIAALMLTATLPALAAANVTLSNGGLGQVASDPNHFGVAVCNKSATALTTSVPITITANSVTATISSVDSIAPGACEYSYAPYTQFNMEAGQNYSMQVSINSGTPTTYQATVPANATAQTASIGVQLGKMFAGIMNWFAGIFKGL